MASSKQYYSGGGGMVNATEVHPHHLLPSVFEAPPEEYVIALHDYEPPSVSPLPPSTSSFSTGPGGNGKRRSTQTAHVCLAFMAGDRIRVLNRDASGWWDGELLVCEDYIIEEGSSGGRDAERQHGNSGGEMEENTQVDRELRNVKILRGWFPSNFVEEAEDRIGLREVPPQNRPNPSFRPFPSTSTSNGQTSSSSHPTAHLDTQYDDDPQRQHTFTSSTSGSSSPHSHSQPQPCAASNTYPYRRTSEAHSDYSHQSHRSQGSSATGGSFTMVDSFSGSSMGLQAGSSRRGMGAKGLQRGSLAASALLHSERAAGHYIQHQYQGSGEPIERAHSSMGYNRPTRQGSASVDDGRSHSSLGHYGGDPRSAREASGVALALHGRPDPLPGGRQLNHPGQGSVRNDRTHQVAESHGSSAILYSQDRRFVRSFSTDTTDTAMTRRSSGGIYEQDGPEERDDVEMVLEPVVQAIALVKAAVISRRHAHFQPSTACVISTIRSLLAATNCLSRESPLLATFPSLGKIRKLILANLAELVALARSASSQSVANGRSPDVEEDEMREMEMEGMVKSADETLGNVRVFLRTMVRCGESLPEKRNGDVGTAPGSDKSAIGRSRTRSGDDSGSSGSVRAAVAGQPTISVRSARSEPGDDRGLPVAQGFASNVPPKASGSATLVAAMVKRDRKSTLQAKSSSDLRMARKQQRESISNAEGAPEVSSLPSKQHGRDTHREQPSVSSISSAGSSRSSSSDSMVEPLTPVLSVHDPSMSVSATSEEVQTATRRIEDQLLSVVAALIGHAHSHTMGSHPSSLAQLIDLTRETVDRIKELLTVVEAVIVRYSRAIPCPREVMGLDQAEANMYEACGKLVANVERIATPGAEVEGDDDGRKAGVIHSATATLRMGASCISLVKAVASRVDFDAPPHEDGDPRAGLGLGASGSRGPPLTSRRTKSVGQRGEHTLSALGRKASNLDSLHLKYERDGYLAPISDDEVQASPVSYAEDTEEEEEEIMVQGTDEEDFTMQPGMRRPNLRSTHTSPLLASVTSPSLEATPVAPSRRSRANSMSSPMTPRLLQHRSPSRSADLNLSGGDFSFVKTPKQGDAFSRRPSLAESPTPVPIVYQGTFVNQENKEPGRSRQPSNNLEVPGLRNFVMPLSTRQDTTDSQPLSDHNAADMRMWLVAHDYSPKEIAFNTDGQIIGATLEVLVEKMTPPDTLVDPVFWDTFFLTFRLFSSPSRVLDALELRYDLAPPARMPLNPATIKTWNERKLMPIRLRIFRLLKTWLDHNWSSEADKEAISALEIFIEERFSTALPTEASRLKELLARQKSRPVSVASKQSGERLAYVRNGSRYQSGSPTSPLHTKTFLTSSTATSLPPTPIMGKQLFNALRNGSGAIAITDFHALELARQLTLMESHLIMNITPEDLLTSGKKRAESLTAMSTLSNRITGWVADSILNEQDTKKRAGLLKFFIKMADRCLSLHNYSSLFAVLAGLNSSTILRLKKTWGGLSTKYRVIMDQLRGLIEHTRNHNNYRSRLRAVDGPALPFLGLVLTDITFTSDGNPNTRPSTLDPELRLINFDKYSKLARIAMDFHRYQVPFNLAVLPDCQTWLERVLAEKGSSSIDALYRKSLVLEPRVGSESIPSSTFEKPSWLQGRI